MSTAQHKTLSDFIVLKNRQALTHAIRAATELGVFRALAKGQRTIEQLASELDADPNRLGALMAVVVQSELVEQYQDDFALSTLARLIPEAFYDFGDHFWKHLVGHVKTGSSVDGMEHIQLDNQDFVVNQAAEAWTLTPAGMTAAEALDMGGSRKELSIIELGCGSAIVGATLIHVDRSSRLTLVDESNAIARAEETVSSIDVASRTALIEADAWFDFEAIDLSATPVNESETGQEMIPQPIFDMVVLTRQVHLLPVDQLRSLFQKIGALLLPKGGELVIVDAFPGQEQGKESFPALELEFGLRHSPGRLHHPKVLEPLLQEAGFPRVQFTHLPAEPYLYGLMVAEK